VIISQTAQYALRVLAYMARRPEGDPVRAKDLSGATSVPGHYLSKIMRRLVEAGLLNSQKGHGGGFTFARPLCEIRFLEVLDAVDVEVESKTCVFGWERCSEANPCPLHPFWSDLKTCYTGWAQYHTLEDIRNGAVPEVL
jgi:Rrf2 family transcriptional regulator, iron-sulfur cluster assembly transcription factor